MKQFEKELQKILENDPLNLLDIKPNASNILSKDERLVLSFEEINKFFEKQGRVPEKSDHIEERKLYSRLQGIKENMEKIEILREYDNFNLLEDIKKEKEVEIKTVTDIFESDTLGLLDKGNNDIFNIKHIPKERELPDYIANRKPCKDFDKFENLFKQCHVELSAGKRKLRPFKKGLQISEGHFFILSGLMVYVTYVGDKEKRNKRTDARLRCVFENGIESNMLLRSLARALYKTDGHRITEHEDRVLKADKISTDDKETGFIYLLKSKSEKKVKIGEEEQRIKDIKNLYKIGYSTTPVEKRVQNSENDPTYLMSKVSVVSEFQCYNMNSQKLELLLHRFFAKSCLEIEVIDFQGKIHKPREWFAVPFPVIEEAIHLLVEGSITKYKYDEETQKIVRNNAG